MRWYFRSFAKEWEINFGIWISKLQRIELSKFNVSNIYILNQKLLLGDGDLDGDMYLKNPMDLKNPYKWLKIKSIPLVKILAKMKGNEKISVGKNLSRRLLWWLMGGDGNIRITYNECIGYPCLLYDFLLSFFFLLLGALLNAVVIGEALNKRIGNNY